MNQMIAPLTSVRNDVVCFRLGEQDYCIDIDVVREIRGWSPATILPHAPDHVTGVINLRGNVVAVVDLSARLHLGRTTPTPRHVVIIVAHGNQTVGLLADVVSDILHIGQEAMRPLPELGADATASFLTNVILLDDGRMLRRINLGAILSDGSRDLRA